MTSETQIITRTPTLLQLIDAQANTLYALNQHNVTSSGCYQDSGTSSGYCSHEILAVRQLLRRLHRLKSSPGLIRLFRKRLKRDLASSSSTFTTSNASTHPLMSLLPGALRRPSPGGQDVSVRWCYRLHAMVFAALPGVYKLHRRFSSLA